MGAINVGKKTASTSTVVGALLGAIVGIVLFTAWAVLAGFGAYEFLSTAWPYLQDTNTTATVGQMVHDGIKLGIIGFAMNIWALWVTLRHTRNLKTKE